MKKYIVIIITLFLASCKLFSPDNDTTSPIVNLTIAGGNEISRGVTLYIDIDDDSKIDYVSVMIDDTTAITVESNFDTIRFDVTPFADENEHILYVNVADKDRNIGESDKIDVVITEFPGWRIYNDIRMGSRAFTIDENDRIWSGYTRNPSSWEYGIHIYDTKLNILLEINTANSGIPGDIIYVNDIEIVQGSRVWINTDKHISEYDYDINRWIKTVEIPLDPLTDRDPLGWTIAVDSNYDVWIGTRDGHQDHKLIKYNHSDFTYYSVPHGYIEIGDMIFHPDGTLYFTGDGGVFNFKEGKANDIGNPIGSGSLVVDSTGDVWSAGNWQYGGALRFDGTNWDEIYIPVSYNNRRYSIKPLMACRNGTLFSNINIFNGMSGLYADIVDMGLATYDGNAWTLWNTLDTPFNLTLDNNTENILSNEAIVESSNGDIWMVAGGKLMRYRPSLGGYP